MTLPKIDLPIYNLQLKTSDKNIKFRPFVVKEERILMMALESNDFETIMQAIKQVINNCVLDEIEIDDLPLFELEHLFLNIRARSVGENVDLSYICQNQIEENVRCNNEMIVSVDLLTVDLETPKVETVLKVTDNIGIKLTILIQKDRTHHSPTVFLVN